MTTTNSGPAVTTTENYNPNVTIGPVSDLPTLNANFSAIANNGKTALVGTAQPYTAYVSTAGVWSPRLTPAAAAAAQAQFTGGGVTLRAPYPMRKVQRALARVRANKGNATIACIGDSLTQGSYAANVVNQSNVGGRPLSWPIALAAILNGNGLSASTSSVIGDNSLYAHPQGSGTTAATAQLNLWDARCVYGASWMNTVGALTAGGQMIYNSTGTLGAAGPETFTFTPATAFDSFVIYYLRNGSATPTFTVNTDGTTVLATINGGASATLSTGTLLKTGGLAAGSINIVRTSTNTAALVGIVAWNSAASTVQVLNMGWPGSQTSSTSWTATGGQTYLPLTVLANQYQPDLSIIYLGTNDVLTGNVATTAANLSLIVANALTTGDALLIAPPPIITSYSGGFATTANQAALNAAIYQVSAAYSVPVLDLTARWQDYNTTNALGYYYSDGLHQIQLGYQDVANAIASVLLSN